MQITKDNLTEEYHLPTQPEKLLKRLNEITSAFRKIYGRPASNNVIEQRINFLEEWAAGIAVTGPKSPTTPKKPMHSPIIPPQTRIVKVKKHPVRNV